jgi:amino acid transporter
MSQLSPGARARAGTDAVNGAGGAVERPRPAERPIGPWAFGGVAVSSFGTLAIAALFAPTTLGGASASAGLTMLAGAVVFILPIAIWLRYSQHVSSSGGLYAFVEAAAGRRVALAQAAAWTVSYFLYLVYTTVQIVYDVLPAVLPGERRYQTLLALVIPVALAAVMVAGRATALAVIGLIAVGQLALAGILDGVTIGHLATPASSFGTGSPTGPFAKASAQTSLLYICGSLPLFLGGELATPARTIRRGLLGSFAVTAVVVTLAVAPFAADPGLTNTVIPGVTVAQQFASPGLADAIGIGVAVSISGLILCEYLALSRLVHAIGRWRMPTGTVAIGALMVLAAPVVLIDPEGIYSALLKVSLVALWISQLIVFAVYPLFARRQRQRPFPAWALGLGASGLAGYGVWTAVQGAAS